MDGDTIVVGAYLEDGAGTDRGAAYVYERASNGTWGNEQKLTASDAANSDWFGYSVAVDGDTIVVGAYGEDGAGTQRGAAYVYQRASNGTWGNEQKLTASNTTNNQWFGYGVAVNGDIIAAGAVGVSSFSAQPMFERNSSGTWSQTQILIGSGPHSGDYFGYSIVIDGDMAVIGAPSPALGSYNGAAYVFERASDGTWSEVTKLLASDGAVNDQYGTSVSISGDTVVVGAPFEETGHAH